MLSQVRRAFPRHWLDPLALALGRLGLTPNGLTVLGVVISAAAALALALGNFPLGGVLILLGGLFDMMDGALARATNQATKFGALLDSTLDRVSEAIVLLGLVVPFAAAGNLLVVVLVFAAMVGSFMVSYVRARAEGLGLECQDGLFTRPERVVVLALGLIVGLAIPALGLLAAMANFTALQRLLQMRREADRA